MMLSPRLLVGFDQFVAIEWAEHALDLAASPTPAQEAAKELRAFLAPHVSSQTNARKTANVLTRLWFSPYVELSNAREQAIQIYRGFPAQNHVSLHWGMAIAVFPLFRETCVQIGRLSRLQGQFKRRDVHARVLEHFGNHSTLARGLNRIMQTLINWAVLSPAGDHFYSTCKVNVGDTLHQQWLLESLVQAAPDQRVMFDDVVRLPEMFPFDLNGEAPNAIMNSARLSVERDGNNMAYVTLK